MTWAELVSKFPQGRNGVYAAKFDGGKVVTKLPWALQMLVAVLLNGYAGGRGVLFVKGAFNLFSWSKSWACVCLCPADMPVDTAAMRTYGGGIHWVGPLAPRSAVCDTVAAVAGEAGVK
jgi:hypothetical protein